MKEIIYLDNNATTKIDPRVLDAMMPFLKDLYANAGSIHSFGGKINQHIKDSRSKIADLISCDSHEIIFTSGATESINIAIKGVVDNYKEKGKHIVTVQTEHPAVLDTCKFLEKTGHEVTYLPVKSDGLLDMENLKKSIRNDTVLVIVMLVNNETGVIQPIKEISEVVHAKDSLFMTDGTQAIGKILIDVDNLGIDIMCFSAHKFYGPKGVGGLYIRSKRPNKVKLSTLIHGGGHERGLRSGTLNVAGIIGLGKAAEIAKQEMNSDAKRIIVLRDYLEKELLKIENTFLNGSMINRLYNVTNICFKGVDADAMIIDLKNIAVSNGSACSSTSVEPSHVLTAIGLKAEDCFSSLRLSLGRFNNKNEVNTTVKLVKNAVANLRLMCNS